MDFSVVKAANVKISTFLPYSRSRSWRFSKLGDSEDNIHTEEMDVKQASDVDSTINKIVDSLNAPAGETHVSFPDTIQTKQSNEKLAPIVTTFEVSESSDANPATQNDPDTSRSAWILLAAATLFESIIIGLTLAYGVFQDHYSREFINGGQIAPYIGVLSSGISFLGAPAVTYACQKLHLNFRLYLVAGWGLCVVSLLGSVFCKSLVALIITQGLIYGFGSLLIEIPMLMIVNTWFEKRRGIAYGIIFAGADIVAIGYTFLIAYLLKSHGLQITMAVLTALVFALAGPAILLLKPREEEKCKIRRCSVTSVEAPYSASPETAVRWSMPIPSKRYYKRSIFYILVTANLLQAFAFYLPFIYLPSFTTEIGHSTGTAAMVLSVANLAQVFGEIGFGQLSDKVHVKFLIIVSTACASLSTILLWGLFGAKSLAALIVFAFLFGSFGSGFLALWARIGTLFGEKDAPMVYSSMCFGRGIGSILSGPISSALLSLTRVEAGAFGAGKFAGIIWFVGSCMAASAIVGGLGILALALKNGHAHLDGKESESARSSMYNTS